MQRLRFNACVVIFLAIFTLNAHASVSFLGVAAGDATSTSAVLWTRAVDSAAPATTALTLEYGTSPLPPDPLNELTALLNGVTQRSGACTTDSTKDYVCKLKLTGLTPNTVYYYRFVGPAKEASSVGRFKTAPDSSTSAPVHFAFSGDNDGLIRQRPAGANDLQL
jgi:phosphodiesterase/alkaline phosphatase D-like protein